MAPIDVPFCRPGVPETMFACWMTGQAGGVGVVPATSTPVEMMASIAIEVDVIINI
jgi:hypothetical protein